MTEGYCKVQVSGTDDPNDLRVVMKVNLIRTFDQGGRTNIPVFLSWILKGVSTVAPRSPRGSNTVQSL